MKINFHDGGPYHIETNPLICGANQQTGFYDRNLVMKELIKPRSPKDFWEWFYKYFEVKNTEWGLVAEFYL